MNNTTMTIIRVAATAIVAGLSAAFAYYPSLVWIPCVLTAFATLGIHAIPAIGQSTNTESTPNVAIVHPGSMMKQSGQPFTGE